MRTHRPKHSELSPEQRRKAITRAYSNVLQRRGKLVPRPCRCGSRKVEKHHPDYANPRRVVWICRPCHLKSHAAEKRAKRLRPAS